MAASALRLQNRVLDLWRSKRPAVTAWLCVGNAFTAEAMARQGFDACLVDCQVRAGVRASWMCVDVVWGVGVNGERPIRPHPTDRVTHPIPFLYPPTHARTIQHGMIDDGTAISMLAAIATVPGVTPLARSASELAISRLCGCLCVHGAGWLVDRSSTGAFR